MFRTSFSLADKIDSSIARWMDCNGRFLLRVSLRDDFHLVRRFKASRPKSRAGLDYQNRVLV